MAKNKYYVVWEGHHRGIFDNWNECKASVENYVGAKYKSFESLDVATTAFREGPANYLGKKSELTAIKSFLNLPNEDRPILPSICVDAACSGNPGTMEFQGVETETRAQFFKSSKYEEGTNNVGEFLAIAWALALMKKNNCDWPIYSDSNNAIKWIKEKKVNTKLIRSSKNEKLFEVLEKALLWLRNNDYPNLVLKWETDKWGEIPADFGRK